MELNLSIMEGSWSEKATAIFKYATELLKAARFIVTQVEGQEKKSDTKRDEVPSIANTMAIGHSLGGSLVLQYAK